MVRDTLYTLACECKLGILKFLVKDRDQTVVLSESPVRLASMSLLVDWEARCDNSFSLNHSLAVVCLVVKQSPCQLSEDNELLYKKAELLRNLFHNQCHRLSHKFLRFNLCPTLDSLHFPLARPDKFTELIFYFFQLSFVLGYKTVKRV